MSIDGVSPTNNHAERSLRMLVIWRKKYMQTTSELGQLFVSRTASVNMTCLLQDKNSFNFFHSIMQHYFAGTEIYPESLIQY